MRTVVNCDQIQVTLDVVILLIGGNGRKSTVHNYKYHDSTVSQTSKHAKQNNLRSFKSPLKTLRQEMLCLVYSKPSKPTRLVWRSGNRHTVLVISTVTSIPTATPYWYSFRPTQPGHPSAGRCNEYWQWFQQLLGRNGEFCVAVSTVTRTVGTLAYYIYDNKL